MKLLGFYLIAAACLAPAAASGQSMGNTGVVQGQVVDPSGAAVAGAMVSLHNPLTSYQQSAATDTSGAFRFLNVPPNPYHLEVTAAGFAVFAQDVVVRNAAPVQAKAELKVAGAQDSVTVEGATADMLELTPSAHVDVDRSALDRLPVSGTADGLSQAIIYSTGGVAADGNGFFHPLGDHAQVSFVVDGQEISDQQSKVFSTQLPANAIQGMELSTGAPAAEFGDKTSLVAQITTRSGLGATKTFGEVGTEYGSFGNASASMALGMGNAHFGNFLAVEGARSGRFLDAPERSAFHDHGNSQTIFNRTDYQTGGADAFHLNLFSARNWTQIPNSYDQLAQDQRQRVLTWSVAPGYQRTFGARALLSVNPYMRKDEFLYYGSRNPFADSPATQSQARQLLNWGVKTDVAFNAGRHTLKGGVDLKQTRLREIFGFGLTDAAYNAPCLDAEGGPSTDVGLTAPTQCAAANLTQNSAFSPGLAPFDLTRGGQQFAFNAARAITQAAVYVQDSITAGAFQVNAGLRFDHYHGITVDNAAQPRLGVAYNLKATGTVLRAAYSRTLETPFNENLLLSSATGVGGLAANVFGSVSKPIEPGRRNQFNVGAQQALGRLLLVDADYFWKFTTNAYDFSTLLNTTITLPISWQRSKVDGVTGRISTTNLRGFMASWTFGHSRARYFGPEVGGLISQGAPIDSGVFRIDHDQAFQSTATARYQRKNAGWVALTWRFDSGMAVSGVPDQTAALALTANQQSTIGLACNGVVATAVSPISSCSGALTSTLLRLPTEAAANPDHNPARVAPRHVLDLGFGTDDLLHREDLKLTASVDITNLTNRTALYNFLSTFSGTHFLQPRAVVARIGYRF